MAYTFSNIQKSLIGPLVIEFGNYTCTNSDTTTVTSPGGMPVIFLFTDANNNVVTTQALSAKALSGGLTTYTLTSSGSVTAGAFCWVWAGQ